MASRPVLRFIKPRQIRQLSLHQHQSQSLLQQNGVPIPRGIVAKSPSELASAVKDLGPSLVSPQLLRHRNAQVAASAEDVIRIAKGHNGEFYISETAPDGQTWYLAMTIDRENYCPAVLVSRHGGKDIQTIVSEHPESISTFDFGLTQGVTEDLVAAVAGAMQIQDRQNIKDILKAMHGIFASKDATMLEITSLAQGKNGRFVAVDSNFTFDDDAGKRQKDLFDLRDKTQEIRDEVEAEKHGLVYIRMDGNIGNVVNGAGLAMATNDAVSLAGGKSANFLDAGGQATKETMIQAFSIILRDERVKAILVNIYGGITRCDMIAESIIGAAAEMDIHVPMVVRLQGTNSPQGLKLLEEANLGLHVESDFGRAAERAVELANKTT